MTEDTQRSRIPKWAPVPVIIAAIALIGSYYVIAILPGQQAPVVPENDAVVTAAPGLSHTIYWENYCTYPVWVDSFGGKQWTDENGKVVGACGKNPEGVCNPNTACPQVPGCEKGDPLADGGGFKLEANGGRHTSTVIQYWQGTFWARTGCTGTDDDLTCEWKTCPGLDGKGKLQCGGTGGSQMTKGELNFDQNGFDTYDVSAVDGFNVPILITPVEGTYVNNAKKDDIKYEYYCTPSGTTYDLKDPSVFPSTLNKDLIAKVNKNPVALLSACQYSVYTTGKENHEYCCSEPDHNTPATCSPTTWPSDMRTDLLFKKYLPGAYSWAFDDSLSTYTCWSKDPATPSAYTVSFCGAPKTTGTSGASSGTAQTPVPSVTSAGSVATPAATIIPYVTQTAVSHGYNPAGSDSGNI